MDNGSAWISQRLYQQLLSTTTTVIARMARMNLVSSSILSMQGVSSSQTYILCYRYLGLSKQHVLL